MSYLVVVHNNITSCVINLRLKVVLSEPPHQIQASKLEYSQPQCNFYRERDPFEIAHDQKTFSLLYHTLLLR